MVFDGEQHVGEPAENVGPDGLALIGAGHAPDLVRRDAEMVGPEPDQPFGESDIRGKGCLGAKLRFVEIDLPTRVGNGFGGVLERRLAWALYASGGHRGRSVRWLLFRLVLGALGQNRLRLPPCVGIGHRAKRLRARRQGGSGRRVRGRMVEFCDQGLARVRRNRLHRSRPRPHAKPVQRQHGPGRRFAAKGGAFENRDVPIAQDHGFRSVSLPNVVLRYVAIKACPGKRGLRRAMALNGACFIERRDQGACRAPGERRR